MAKRGHDRRFFDPRPPGNRRKNAETMVHNFNARFPVGTEIRVYPGARWIDDRFKDTTVAAPGAFINSAGHPVVKIPGDCIALTHVIVLADGLTVPARTNQKRGVAGASGAADCAPKP